MSSDIDRVSARRALVRQLMSIFPPEVYEKARNAATEHHDSETPKPQIREDILSNLQFPSNSF